MNGLNEKLKLVASEKPQL